MNVGHNSVQTPHDGRLTFAESERARLIEKGIIRPISRIEPQLMHKAPDGSWRPSFKFI